MIEVMLLGGFRLRVDGEVVRTPAGVQRLVAFIALRGPTTRTMAAGALWSHVDERRAQASLRTSIWDANRQCSALVVACGTDLVLNKDVHVDVSETDARARRILTDPSSVPKADLTADVINRELLAGWYEDWVLAERERSRQLRLHALEAASQELLNRDNVGAAMDAALKVVSAEPLRETAHRLTIGIHIAEGNTSEAVRHYMSYRQLLGDELGLAPSPQMQELVADCMTACRMGAGAPSGSNDDESLSARLAQPHRRSRIDSGSAPG
jgi:DNA-binding SARP family transcriptional activator